MRKLILETDIGRDPDDLFSLLYLIHASRTNNFKVVAIVITPGDRDQIALVRFVLDQCNLKIPIGIPRKNWDRNKLSSGGVHYALMNKYRYPIDQGVPDGDSLDVINSVWDDFCEVLVIGPATNFADFLQNNFMSSEQTHHEVTFQGGFLPYSLYRPDVVLDKFEGQEAIPSFNPNGDRDAFHLVQKHCPYTKYVTKTVCHTMEFTPDKVHRPTDRTIQPHGGEHPEIAAFLYEDLANLYFEKHTEKKFHDPTAAVCHIHPDVAGWYHGMVVKRGIGWTTVPCNSTEDDYKVLGDLDRDAVWKHLKELN